MRIVSPAFSRQNQGGPFAPIIGGKSLRMSPDSFLFLDGMIFNSVVQLTMKETEISSDFKAYIEINFNNGLYVGAKIVQGSDWWPDYPKAAKFNGDVRKIDAQAALYAPVFSVQKGGFYGGYAYTTEGAFTVYRHIYTNLMLMQACNYYFLLPAPSAPPFNVV